MRHGEQFPDNTGLRVFTLGGEEWVVAKDAKDAVLVWCEAMGEAPEDYPAEQQEWDALDPLEAITMAVDNEGAICPVEDMFAQITMPAAAWALKEGRGHLGSTDG